MKLRNLLLIMTALPLLGACVAYDNGYGGGYATAPAYGYAAPAYYGDAYPSQTYIEYNNSYSHRGGYRENYWAHDRAREAVHENHGVARAAAHEEYHDDDHHDEHGAGHGHGHWNR